jgi:hypothetical protein
MSPGLADDEWSDGQGQAAAAQPSERDFLTYDSKDVLVDRLQDLVQRLSNGGDLTDVNIDALHAKVDDMEKILVGEGSLVRRRRPRPLLPLQQMDSTMSSTSSPAEHHARDSLKSMSNNSSADAEPSHQPKDNKESAEMAEKLAAESEKLYAEVATVLASLQARREEVDVRGYSHESRSMLLTFFLASISQVC